MYSNNNYFEIIGYKGYRISKEGCVYSDKSKKILKPNIHKNGDRKACVRYKINDSYISRARLLAITFIEKDDDNCNIVMHIDGDTLNDNLDNLTWISRDKQYINPNTNGKITGEKHVNSKLTDDDVRDIKKRILNNESITSIHKDYKFVTIHALYDIKREKSWRHIKI